jgi:hypothetical protein
MDETRYWTNDMAAWTSRRAGRIRSSRDGATEATFAQRASVPLPDAKKIKGSTTTTAWAVVRQILRN